MPVDITLVKAQDGALRPATNVDQDAMRKWKLGQALRVEATQVRPRSLQYHKRFFGGLLTLALDYYEPPGGLISPTERHTLENFAKWLDAQGGNTGAVRRAQEAYLADLEKRRAAKHETPEKSIEDLLEWLKLEIGHYDLIQTPRGTIKRTRSISFSAMDQSKFEDFYKRCFTVIWRYILSQTFASEAEAENAIQQLVELG